MQASKAKRKKNFKFSDYNINAGSYLIFTRNPNIRCTVVSDGYVQYQNEVYSLTSLTNNLLKKLGKTGQANGYFYWKFNGTTLHKLRQK